MPDKATGLLCSRGISFEQREKITDRRGCSELQWIVKKIPSNSFLLQIFIEHPLCAEHCSVLRELICEYNKDSCPRGTYIPAQGLRETRPMRLRETESCHTPEPSVGQASVGQASVGTVATVQCGTMGTVQFGYSPVWHSPVWYSPGWVQSSVGQWGQFSEGTVQCDTVQ